MVFHHFGPPQVHHGWWFLGGVVPLVLFAVLIGVVIWAVVRVTSPSRPAMAGWTGVSRRDGALEEVRLRYARGEMTRDEFVQRYRDLGGAEPEPPAAETPPPPPA